jgi:hypothetical protein
MLGVVAAAVLVSGACSDSPTMPAGDADDYSLVMFGEAGAALEGTLGPQGGRPFDGRTGAPHLPEALALSAEQRSQIEALRAEFRTEHEAELDALHAIFDEAHEARDDGATREEVRAILEGGRDIGESLREDVQALHEAIKDVLTDAQRSWIESHRRPPPHGRAGLLGPRRR